MATHPDHTQKERARHFWISHHCIWHALKRMHLSRKKMVGYKERDPRQEKAYLHLRERSHRRDKELVYIDESGFVLTSTHRYAYAPKGQWGYGLISGHRRPRTSLIATRVGPTFEVPLLFAGPCSTNVFNPWLDKELCPLFNETHVMVRDNTPFHKSAKTQELINRQGATLFFLPP